MPSSLLRCSMLCCVRDQLSFAGIHVLQACYPHTVQCCAELYLLCCSTLCYVPVNTTKACFCSRMLCSDCALLCCAELS